MPTEAELVLALRIDRREIHRMEIEVLPLFPFVFFLMMMLLGLVAFAFWIWMLIDCLQNEPSEGNDKLVWILVIVFAQLIGALIYFFVQRPKRRGRHPTQLT